MTFPSKEQAGAWLAGFIDGEGCVYYRKTKLPNGKAHQVRVVTITNTDLALIEFAARCFEVLGIEYRRSDRPGATENRKHRYVIEVTKGQAMSRLRDLVPIQAPEKRRKLDEALESYRGLNCAGCGCLRDESTPGCTNCRKRHYFRSATRRYRERLAAG
ncbi:LAGLIDADG family homing endonuclease [Cupriavidus sp.]|uniref:LAGLIDADG family homing endonuclease n=1 Tax=Cupriavidus sp. TaxID=1873897 RepID=UPI0028BF4FB4|nr:LAGLIDADG family homing endonuclease [Cupriavidus sp.]